MDFESIPSPTETEYLEMIRKKTACLLGVSLQMGAILAGANHQEVHTLYQFGEKLGLGFQIQDDYLDVFGEEQQTGKVKGGDILRGKKNFLYVHAYTTFSPAEQKEFAGAYQKASSEQDTSSILEVYQNLKIDQYAQIIQTGFFEKGMKELASLKLSETTRLEDLVSQLMIREH